MSTVSKNAAAKNSATKNASGFSRRGFLKSTAAASGALVVAVYVPELDPQHAARAAEGSKAAAAEPFSPNAFVRINADDSVTVMINHTELGQGTMTSLAMLVAEELDADWSRVKAEHAPINPAFNHVGYGIQMVGGSTSVRTEWERMRKAGATARAMLVAAAAQEWGVEPADCTVSDSIVTHAASDRKAKFGSLVAAAAKMTAPVDVKLKSSKDFKLLGKATRRLDSPDKVNGKAQFTLDVNLPGMLTAVIARPPVFGGKVKQFDATKAEAIPGVKRVVQIDRGVAVVADGYWAASRGRAALDIEWDDGELGEMSSESQLAEYAALAENSGAMATDKGDVARGLAEATTTLDAVYTLPYLAHATMEPMNCVADVREDSCDVYSGTQFQTGDWMSTVMATGFDPDKVKVHTMLAGGGFGRRAVIDAHFTKEAVALSQEMKAPVKVVWSREDDTRGGYYRPTAYHKLTGTLDADGKIAAWKHDIVCQSFLAGTPFAAMIKNGVDETAVEGAKDMPYAIDNVRVNWHVAPAGVPTLWLRSVGHSHTAFVVEGFLDELIHAAGQDPLEVRRKLLADHPRHKKVLELAAEKAGWGKKLPEGHGMGLAVHESFGSFAAHVVEASASPEGVVRVHRVVAAIDCGPIVNPDTIKAQLEGGVAFGLSAALYGQITFKKGRVEQSNFHDYPLLRMNEMPVVETYIVESNDVQGGVGEPVVPSVAPALANALFAATGRRLRKLPIRPDDLKQSTEKTQS